MVSELLQDRPRLVKQMGSVIFILVYKWIFKFPLGYLNYHQRRAFLKSPSSQSYIPERFFPREAAQISSYGPSLVLLYLWWNSWISARSGPTLCASGSVSGAWHSPGSLLSRPVPAARQSSVQCWKSRCRWLCVSCGAAWPPLLSSSLTAFVPCINSQSRKALNGWSSAEGQSGWWWLARAITVGWHLKKTCL